MSFGFSIGDIVLVSQLAHRLYFTVTTGRRSAGKDLKELEDVLFGLRCSLDHLGKAAKDISATTSNRQDANANVVRQKLDTMVNACSATLQELDSVTKRYREAAHTDESDVVGDTTGLPATGIATNPNQKRPLDRLKQSVRVNWMKIRWDMERASLNEYRQKLQAHTDAINIVLNTFLWSTTSRIEVDSKVNAEKMQALQNQALQSNTSLLQLVQEIHTMLLASKHASSPSPTCPPEISSLHHGIVQKMQLAPAVPGLGGLQDGTIHSISPHYGSVALFATKQLPPPLPLPPSQPSNPFGPLAMGQGLPPKAGGTVQNPASTCKLAEAEQTRKLPVAIALLNERRQATGSKEFKEYQKKYQPPKPVAKPSFLDVEVPTIRQLHESLDYIFRPFASTGARQANIHRDERKKEIVRWIQGLDHLVDSWISEPRSSPSGSNEAEQTKRHEIVELLVRLNGSMEDSDERIKSVFYQGTEQAGIDEVLDKLQTVSRSVRVMKEVEEFQDVREEWKESRHWG